VLLKILSPLAAEYDAMLFAAPDSFSHQHDARNVPYDLNVTYFHPGNIALSIVTLIDGAFGFPHPGESAFTYADA
jgi:hypothetical protein